MGARLRRALAVGLFLLAPSCIPSTPPPAGEWPARPQVGQVILQHAVYFETNRDQLKPAERARLVEFLSSLPGRPVGPIRVIGHADERGTALYNLDLAARRARTVAELIQGRFRQPVRVETQSLGEHWPADPSFGPEAWARNRRAEVTLQVPVLKVEGCMPYVPSPGYRLDNGPLAGLGCATAYNLLTMLAEPADLAAPTALAPAPSTAAAAAVQRYQDGKVTPLLDVWGDGR